MTGYPQAIRKIKYVATINDDTLPESMDPDWELEYIDIGNVEAGAGITGKATYRFEDAPSRARRCVRHGDVIVSTVRTYLQAIAPIVDPPANLIVSTGFAVVRPMQGKLDSGFCRYVLSDPGFLAEVERRSVGVSYPAINASDLAAIPVACPPLPRQRSIAEYLDREIAKIDAMIAAKQRLRAILAEKRRALITHAVTRGLNPNAPTRDSGNEWLGKIPSHWTATRLKFLADIRGGVTLGKTYGSAHLIDVPYLRVANVQAGFVDLTELKTIAVPAEERDRYLLQVGDLLMTEGGDIDKLGRGCVWSGQVAPCIHQNHVFAVRSHETDPHWLARWTDADPSRAYFEITAKRSTNLASISATNIGELPVVLPPRSEMLVLLQHLERETSRFDAVAESTRRTVGLLCERRSALIAATIAGQHAVEDAL
jgi:type I restriction enzyme S subunit